ncbi:MAG: hypothetical protein IT425_15500 [Pirellulales bacterium]|nr:hypothetical protein [Pirellulales bacterium]
MKRTFWTAVLLAITLTGGWTLYVGAQELQKEIGFGSVSEAKLPRFQFVEHFFLNEGEPYEIFLRLDRQSGLTWRYHATQSGWAAIKESSKDTLAGEQPDRYELLSHVYRNEQGIQLERMMRVDYQSGRSWAYDPAASQWAEIEVEGAPSANQQASTPTAQPQTPASAERPAENAQASAK